jgi:LmbE family N-acetylglucosaminyl deacetylase
LQGDETTVVFLSDGSRCVKSNPDIVAQREAEAVKAVQGILGVQRLFFLRYPDQGLNSSPGLGAQLRSILEQLSPDILYVPSAWDPHPDHITVANLVSTLTDCVGSLIRIYESFSPLTPYLFNRCVDITDVASVKAVAMTAFSSQVVSFRSIALLNRIHSRVAHRTGVSSVEVFLEVPPARYSSVCELLTSSPLRPRRISHIRNVVRSYLTTLFRARTLRSRLQHLLCT